MVGKALIDFVMRKLLSKKLSRKRGIETIAGPEQKTVLDIQSKQLFNDMSKAGFDMNTIKENDVMYFLNLKRQKMDEMIKSQFDEAGLGEGIKSLEQKKPPFQGWTPKVVTTDPHKKKQSLFEKHQQETKDIPTDTGMKFYSDLSDTMKRHEWEELELDYDTMYNKLVEKAKRIDADPKALLEAELGTKLTGKESATEILEIFKKSRGPSGSEIAEEIKLAYPKIKLRGDETREELKEMLKHLDEEDVPFQSGGLAYLLGEPDYMKAEGGRAGLMYGGDPGFAFEYGGSWADWQDKHKHAMPIEDYVKTKMPKERLPFRHLEPADSLGYDDGGKVKKLLGKGITRRTFLGGLLSLLATPFMKFGGKQAAVKATPKVVAAVANSNAVGKPPWLDLLIARVIREGDDLTAKTATSPQQTVHKVTLPESGTPVEVTHDLTTGSTIVDIGEQTKHGWSAGRHGQPTRLILNKGEWIEPDVLKPGAKGTKTKDEFLVEEAEFTGGHPENVKFEETVEFKYGDHGSDFSEIEQYATKSPVTSGSSHGEVQRSLRREGWHGKKEKARQLAMDKKYGGLKSTYKKDPHVRGKQADLDAWAEGRAESMAEDIDPEFASGGIAHLLGE